MMMFNSRQTRRALLTGFALLCITACNDAQPVDDAGHDANSDNSMSSDSLENDTNCGDNTCAPNAEYCEVMVSDIGGDDTTTCKSLPESCLNAVDPTCDCFNGGAVCELCEQDDDGLFRLTCPGG